MQSANQAKEVVVDELKKDCKALNGIVRNLDRKCSDLEQEIGALKDAHARDDAEKQSMLRDGARQQQVRPLPLL